MVSPSWLANGTEGAFTKYLAVLEAPQRSVAPNILWEVEMIGFQTRRRSFCLFYPNFTEKSGDADCKFSTL